MTTLGPSVRGLRRLPLAWLAAAFVAQSPAHAAPDEDLLGKAEGYPICPKSLRPEPRCLVGLVSRFDEVFPARVVKRGEWVRPLARADHEPAIRYRYGNTTGGVDDYLARNRATGFLIVAGETILAERYQYDRTAAHRMQSFSMAKTVVAMLVGIALAEGKIRSLDDPAEAYVPALLGTPYGQTRLRDLLTMSSGVRFVENYSGRDDVAELSRLSIGGESGGGAATVQPFQARERPAGERFSYSSAETQVLGLVLRGATGRLLAEYLSEKIWQPMGAEADASWLVDAGGYEAAYFGINATLRDWARFGMLLAGDGAVQGRQVIPAAWVRAATTPSATQFEPGKTGQLLGYGYQTWLLGGADREFAAIGLRGQAIYVAPKTKLVMVQTAAANLATPSTGELLSLWTGVQRSLAGAPPN